MKRNLLILGILMLSFSVSYSQTTLYSESFETDGEGVRYFSNTYNDCMTFDNPDYFFRTNTNPVLPPTMCTAGFGNALTNLQGSWFWAGEDIRSNLAGPPGARPPGSIISQSIGITNYNNLQVSLYLATANNNGTRWESSDSINIQASINGGFYKTVGRFVGDALSGGNLREDLNLDGTADGAIVSVSNFMKYTFNIPGSGSTLRINLDFDQYGGTEESAIDLIEVKGTLVLPVELLRFEAVKNGNAVDVKWATSSEKDNAYFAVERSVDMDEFKEIGIVKPAPAAAGIHDYIWTDMHPGAGTNYYRLRQYDADGTSSVSSIAEVKMGNGRNIIRISPNPASTQATLLLQQEKEDVVQITLYDLQGNLQSSENAQVNKGLNYINIPILQLENGMYIMRVTSDGKSGFSKFIKQ